MPPKEGAGSPRDWLEHAKSDLNLMKAGKTVGVLNEDLCFHSQQAVEKSIKAVLLYQGIPFPKTHNIKTLVEALPMNCLVSEQLRESASLTDYAVTTRYPGVYEEVTDEEYWHALRLAASVVDWADSIINQ